MWVEWVRGLGGNTTPGSGDYTRTTGRTTILQITMRPGETSQRNTRTLHESEFGREICMKYKDQEKEEEVIRRTSDVMTVY